MAECKLKNLVTRSQNSRGSCRSARLTYVVSGITEPDPGAAALAQVRRTAPETLDGAPLARVTLAKNHGGGIFEVLAEYEHETAERTSRRRIGDREWTFDCTGGQEHIYSGELINAVNLQSAAPPPDPAGLVNWNGRSGDRSQVRGTVKLVPSMRENCLAVFKESDVTASFRRQIMELTGTLNQKPFHSWEPGEVLFLGASSALPFRNDQGKKVVEVTFRFAIKRNIPSLEIAGVKLGAAGGWDIPWVVVGTGVARQAPRPAGAYLSSIYEKGDFSLLKL